MQNPVITFLLARRSVVAKKMIPDAPTDEDLNNIIACGLRVPDHSNVQPWRLVVLQGEAKKQFDHQVILKAALQQSATQTDDSSGHTAADKLHNKNTNDIGQGTLSKTLQTLESSRMQRSGVVIAVLSTPVVPHKIPLWEQQLSAGAVCTNLLLAAQSLGYAAQWLTEWPAYDNIVIDALGGNAESDRVAGFIHIGRKKEAPTERKRPDLTEKVDWWQAPG